MKHSPRVRPARLIRPAPLAALLMLVLVACGGDSSQASPTPSSDGGTPAASPTETPGSGEPTSTPASPTPGPDPEVTPASANGTAPDRQVRDLLLTSELGISGVNEREDISAIAIPLDEERSTWFAVSTGPGAASMLGERSQVAGVFEQRNGGWLPLDSHRLESTPTHTQVQLVPGASADGQRWVAVFGEIEEAGSTFELFRFDGSDLTSQLWWYSPVGPAAQLLDLEGDGRMELVMDASDPSVLCSGCGVIDYQEVIYRWDGGALRAVEFAPVDSGGEVASIVAEGVAQVRAGLWREAASTLSAASAIAPTDEDVRWMATLAARVADGRLRHAGATVQPMLTQVLAGEYETAVEEIRGRPPADVFDRRGVVVAGTAADGYVSEMGELLIEHARRAIAYDAERPEPYVIRAVGHVLAADDRSTAAADMRTAADLAPGIPFYGDSAAWLEGGLPDQATPAPAADDTTDGGDTSDAIDDATGDAGSGDDQ